MAEGASARANPQLTELEFLIGEWEMQLSNGAFLPNPSDKVRGQVSFEWLENGAFLLMRMGDALWLINRDDAQPLYTVFYYDARAVSRVYMMRYAEKIWTIWRDSAQFSQRLTARVSEDGRTITGSWEKRSDQNAWEHDFDVCYRRLW